MNPRPAGLARRGASRAEAALAAARAHALAYARACAMAGAAAWGAVAAAAPAVWRLELASDHHCDALPLSALGDPGWSAVMPRSGRNLAYLDDSVALARDDAHSGWGWSLLARSTLSLVASDGALALAKQASSGQAPTMNTRWAVKVAYEGFIGAGLELRRRWSPGPGWTLTPSLQLLRLSRWRERSADGTVAYQAADTTGAPRYTAQVETLQVFDGLAFPYQQARAAQGLGLLPGLVIAHQQADGWFGSLTLRDGGWLRWPGIPRQTLSLQTDRQTTDAAGFLVYGPLVEGQNSQQPASNRRAWRSTGVIGLATATGQSWSLVLDHRPGLDLLPAVQWQGRIGPVDLGAQWRLHEARLTGTLAWQGLSLRMGADRLGAGSRSREMALAWSSGF